MDNFSRYSARPFAFVGRYLRARPVSHVVIVGAVALAVICSVGTQYGIKFLVDSLSRGMAGDVWLAFALLGSLIAADNLLWRVASWIASTTFVRVTGDLRRDLFRHLTGHAPGYFADRLPGTLTSRITATSNAVFAMQNMFVWNVLPPCLATVSAIAFVTVISVPMAGILAIVGGVVVVAMFRLAAAGKPLHHDFAAKAAAVDGEMVDVVTNMPLVKAFCGIRRELDRFEATVDREIASRRRSLLYLEKLRLGHAVVTVIFTIGLVAWAIMLWQRGQATPGDVVLACTLGLSVLHATRDLAVALVDVTQHVARLSEALATLLVQHELSDHPEAAPLVKHGARIEFDNISFGYPDGHLVFRNFSLRLESDQRIGLVGQSGGGKSTLFALLQRFYDVQRGRILIDGQDIARVTQDSLRSAIALVPQDISLFQRSIMENIRYGRPDATDEEVMQAAAAARCEFIGDLPGDFEMMVGDRGVKLSGGQRQRIAIARAFLKDAPILLLDEATASLDSDSEEAVREALGRLMQGRTVIAITHRLSTLRNFDRIIVLKAGRVIEDGAPDLLMKRKGPYYELVRREMSRLTRRAA
ncbi:MAG TPA: ABC transporter ATP-binding protein [Pseudolabrys sp.]|nr:ABC transporter ATP-binding protein [Pseudolabrys sp.]